MKFSFRGREEPPLQLYGKLPIAKDYLRVGGGSDAGRRFREWLDRGFGGGASDLPHPMRFLWMDRDDTALQGLVRPSSDAGGLRRFPFALFVERRTRELDRERGLSGAGDGGWWLALERCEQEIAGFREASELLSAMRTRSVIRSDPGNPAARVDFDAWVAALWPGEGRSGCERALAGLAAHSPGQPVRLPLAWGWDIGSQVSAWTGILGELGGNDSPTLFFPARQVPSGEEPAALAVLGASPDPDDSRWLRPSREPNGPGDLVPPGPTRVGAAEAPVGMALDAGLRASLSALRPRRGAD